MTSLADYGWDHFFQPIQNTKQELTIGRIISIQGFTYALFTGQGEQEATLSGRLLHGASPEELPKVGDWVTFIDHDSPGYIIDVLPRRNELSRKAPGAKTEKQLLAANIDYALVVQSLDRNFNLMRLERYLVQLAACSIQPVIILSKADLIQDHTPYAYEIRKLQRSCPVHFCSTLTGVGLDELRDTLLQKQKTYILIGSSGVGKSTLLNALMGSSTQEVSPVSTANSKGRHTTTTRDLFLLPNGSLLIDTPGMREFGLTWEENGNTDSLFPAIARFANECRFRDCQHIHEKECAVREAVHRGELDKKVYESYLKLVREQRRFEINADDQRRMNKQAGRISREAQRHRNRYKG